jgi:hypothetical protein
METLNEQTSSSALHGELTEPIQFKKGCMLNSLTVAQQEQLFDWAELLPNKTVLERVALPAPEGFGLKMHLTTLRRFHRAARLRFQKELTDSSDESLAEPPADLAVLDRLTETALRQFAVEMVTVQDRDPARFAAVSRWVLRLQQNAHRDRELKILEERLALEKEKAALEKTKFEFNSARAALLHHRELKDIIVEHPGDSEDKIWAAREKIFPQDSALIENPNLNPPIPSNEPKLTQYPEASSHQNPPRSAEFIPPEATEPLNHPMNPKQSFTPSLDPRLWTLDWNQISKSTISCDSVMDFGSGLCRFSLADTRQNLTQTLSQIPSSRRNKLPRTPLIDTTPGHPYVRCSCLS